MFKQSIKEKYPFLTDYFESGLKNEQRALAHSILFYGNDISVQYEFALEISRLLNCKESKSEDCGCLNCNWIIDKKHPAVLTISKLDNKPSDDDSKTVISVKQSQMVKNLLLNTSEYHRVFVFCDAKQEKDDTTEDGQKWIPLGLNETNFQAETANSLLKIIEEPPANTTFFFLTRDKNDLLETIISRSQSFFVPSFNRDKRSFSAVEDALAAYPQIERKDSFDVAQALFAISKELGSEELFNQIQNYLSGLLKSNLDNDLLKLKIINDLKLVNNAQSMVSCHINPQLAIEDMCLNLTKSL